MRRSSSYTWSASRSSAAWSPPLQALSKAVTSTDRVGTGALLQKKIPRPWPVFGLASAYSGEGERGDENHGSGGGGREGGEGWDGKRKCGRGEGGDSSARRSNRRSSGRAGGE